MAPIEDFEILKQNPCNFLVCTGRPLPVLKMEQFSTDGRSGLSVKSKTVASNGLNE